MIKNRLFLLFSFGFLVSFIYGQEVPLYPVSFRVFTPYVLNPAMTGSKDYTSLHFVTSVDGTPESQIVGGHTRLIKSGKSISSSFERPDFSHIGVGGYLFNEKTNSYRNVGINAMISYHIPLNRNRISHLAFGLSGKGIYTIKDPGNSVSDSSNSKTHTFTPDADLGLYFYGARLSTGVSVINIANSRPSKDSLGLWKPAMSRQYSFVTSYKLLINKQDAFVLEPFILFNSDDKTPREFYKNIHPGLKVYFRNVYLGTYFNSWSSLSFFMQYHFPRFLTGFYFEAPTDGSVAWRNKKLILEFMVGINLSGTKIEARKYRY